MAVFIPAILTRDPDEVLEKLEFLSQFHEIADVQIDFADGEFVPNTTVLPNQLSRFDDRFAIEAHLMLRRPNYFFHNLEVLGVDTVIIHYESFHNSEELKTALKNIRHLGMKNGVAVNPQTETQVLDGVMEEIDLALIMGVNPGFQGSPFAQETFARIEALRKKHPNAIIEVDGGIKLDNFGLALSAGADRIVVGSGLWVTPDPEETIKNFLEILNR